MFAASIALAAVAAAAATAALVRHRTARLVGERLASEIGSAHLEAQEAKAALLTRDLVLDSMEEGVLLAAPDGLVTFANPAVEQLLGSRPREVAYINPPSLRHALAQAAAGEHVTVEAEVGAPARWLRAAASPVGDDGSALLVVRDVTRAKRLDEIRRDLVANASHELKTPAATIQAAAETARYVAADDPAALPRFLEQLEREAVRLSRIVADLLDLSRLESGSEADDTVPLDEVVEEEVARSAETAEAAGVGLSTDIAQATVRGSTRDLALMVRNLVENAVHYTRPGGKVEVALKSIGSEVVLCVRDTGIGIASRDMPRVFERFYRADRARSRETGGTGLGLSIVKHVAENHGGTVSVASELGQGSEFEVRLPRYP